MANIVVSSGVTSSGIVLNAGDTMSVLSAGTAISTTVNNGGVLSVFSEGTDQSAHISSGGSEVFPASTPSRSAMSSAPAAR